MTRDGVPGGVVWWLGRIHCRGWRGSTGWPARRMLRARARGRIVGAALVAPLEAVPAAPMALAPLVLAVAVVVAMVGVSADVDAPSPAPPTGRSQQVLPAEAPAVTTSVAEKPAEPPPPPAKPLPVTPGLAPVITRIETTDPVVFLTIDDGLVRQPDTLAAFAELGVPATLFLNDGPILKDADFFRSMAGTVVQAHTRHHPQLRRLSEDGQVEQICGNAELIASTFGKRPTLFRPPYGAYNEATRRAAARCGMSALVLWEADVHRDRISFAHHASFRPGDIILMHFRSHFREELEMVARQVREAGLRFAALEDYIVTAPPAATSPAASPASPPSSAAPNGPT